MTYCNSVVLLLLLLINYYSMFLHFSLLAINYNYHLDMISRKAYNHLGHSLHTVCCQPGEVKIAQQWVPKTLEINLLYVRYRILKYFFDFTLKCTLSHANAVESIDGGDLLPNRRLAMKFGNALNNGVIESKVRVEVAKFDELNSVPSGQQSKCFTERQTYIQYECGVCISASVKYSMLGLWSSKLCPRQLTEIWNTAIMMWS